MQDTINTTIEEPGIEDPVKAELMTLARELDAWRAARDMSKREFFSQVGGLNDKTFRKVMEGDFAELKPENHLPGFQRAWEECLRFDQREQKEELFAELKPASDVVALLQSLKLQRTGMERFALIEGESGAGKTCSLEVASKHISDMVILPAHEGWGKPSLAMEELLKAVGYESGPRGLPAGFAERHKVLVEWLAGRKPVMIAIDEAHHTNTAVLNVMKDIINRTGGWVVIAPLGSLWKKVQANQWKEVMQLLHNRMHGRVKLKPPGKGDVELYMERRIGFKAPEGKEGKVWTEVFAEVSRVAEHNGLYAFTRKVSSAVRLLSRGKEVTPEMVRACCTAVQMNLGGN